MQLDIFELLDPPVVDRKAIKDLNCQLVIWAFEYYKLDKPSATDAEYDGVYQEYSSLIKNTDYRPFCDMSVQVGPPSRMAYHAAKLKGVSYEGNIMCTH